MALESEQSQPALDPSQVPAQSETTGTIGCGETVTGELTSDDPPGLFDQYRVQDTYEFRGTAEEEVTVTIDGTDPYGYADPMLYLLDPDGTVVAESGYSYTGQDALVSQVLPETGDYTVVAAGYIDDQAFGYELSLACDAEPFVYPVSCDDTIECGQTVVDQLSADDDKGFRGPRYLHDAYCFDAEEGDVVTVSMAPAAFGYEEPYLYLLGPNGAIAAQDQYGGGYGNAVIQSYEVRESGEHTVVATSAYEASVFDYTLALQCE